MTRPYDIAIIGAGVVGCAIAREFSRYNLKVVVLEADSDIGNGASKGNSAVLSTASDTPAGTLERQLVRRGHERYRAEAPALGLPIEDLGSLTVAWNDAEAATVRAMHRAMVAEGFDDAHLVGPDEIYRRTPALAPGAVTALWEAEEAIVDPFSTPLAYALDALANGVEISCGSPVTAARFVERHWRLATPAREVDARLVINCGGLFGDRVDALGGNTEIKIKPRRGEFIVFDKSARGLLDVILKPVANPLGRGILLTPTVFGNILVGPTAEPIDDPDDWRCTPEGLAALQAAARRLLPGLLAHEVTTTYSGLRPGSDRPEYRIVVRGERRWITVAGIRSTGLSAALGIAEYVVAQAMDGLVAAPRKAGVVAITVPPLWERGPRPALDPACISRDARYGEMICYCEKVSRGEIEDALASPLPPRSLKALKRRTRAMFGRCQGFFCGARVTAMLDQSFPIGAMRLNAMLPSDPDALVIGAGPAGLAAAHALLKNGANSIVIVDRDEAPGGLPQYCGHLGFGWGYTHRLETGPAFTRRLLNAIQHPSLRLLARTTAMAIRPGPAVDLVGPECGVITLHPRTVIVATGIRERPRAARLVPGRRPERGVLTTGQLQQMVARGVPLPGQRMVVVGTEHVAFSVLLTARHAGHRVVAMVEPAERASTYPALAALARHVARIPIHLQSRIVNILGGHQVEGVEIEGPAGRHRIACDSVVFSGDFIPDAVLAQASGIAIDPRTKGPVVDQHGRTAMPGVFAAGNVLRAVESSGFSAIEGARVGACVAAHLCQATTWSARSCPIDAAPAFSYVVPQRWTPDDSALAAIPFSLRVPSNGAPIPIIVRIGEQVVWQDAPRRRRPHRRIHIPQTAIAGHVAEAPSIEVSVTP